MGRPRTQLAWFDNAVAIVLEMDVSRYDEMYDEMLFHQPDASRKGAVSLLDVALSGFQRLCADPCTRLDIIILVLNQYALFRDKFRTRSDLQTRYPDNRGRSENAMALGRFTMLNRNQSRHTYIYYVGDDNPNIARCISNAINEAILQEIVFRPT